MFVPAETAATDDNKRIGGYREKLPKECMALPSASR